MQWAAIPEPVARAPRHARKHPIRRTPAEEQALAEAKALLDAIETARPVVVPDEPEIVVVVAEEEIEGEPPMENAA